jgi:hypothetical protein
MGLNLRPTPRTWFAVSSLLHDPIADQTENVGTQMLGPTGLMAFA